MYSWLVSPFSIFKASDSRLVFPLVTVLSSLPLACTYRTHGVTLIPPRPSSTISLSSGQLTHNFNILLLSNIIYLQILGIRTYLAEPLSCYDYTLYTYNLYAHTISPSLSFCLSKMDKCKHTIHALLIFFFPCLLI